MKRLLLLFPLLLTLGCPDYGYQMLDPYDICKHEPCPDKHYPNIKIRQYQVERVVDGDTIVLANGDRVRLIGVDTPETKHPRKPVECYGKEASAFTKLTVEGKSVTLKFDNNKTDRYGRTLAYVYLQDGTLLNEEIIRQGYGKAYSKYDFKHMESFIETEKKAKELNIGLWGVCKQ